MEVFGWENRQGEIALGYQFLVQDFELFLAMVVIDELNIVLACEGPQAELEGGTQHFFYIYVKLANKKDIKIQHLKMVIRSPLLSAHTFKPANLLFLSVNYTPNWVVFSLI